MGNNIKKILEGLYLLDPELKTREKELINIINKLIKSKPNLKLDNSFVLKLREELLRENKKLSLTSIKEVVNNFMKTKLLLTAGGMAIVLLAIFTAVNLKNQDSLNLNLSEMNINENAKMAFGSLSTIAQEAIKESTMAGSEMARGLGGGGNGLLSADAKMIAPPYNYDNYKYIYDGEEINLENSFLPVYKRIKKINTDNYANLIKNINIDLADMDKFANLNIDNLNLSEDKEFGYGIYFDLKEGMISINQNWNKWPRPEDECNMTDMEANRKCFDDIRLKISDMLSDDELINIANNFLIDYSINMDNYGEAVADNNWRNTYEMSENKENAYIPDTVQITYPLVINEQTVYDQSGNPNGLSVSVNIRYKKVSGVHSLSSQNFNSSDYEIITNSEKIIELAEKGGMFNYYQSYSDSSSENMLLDTPKLTLIRYYQYENNENNELLIPALVFPIKNIPKDNYFYRKNIIVPIEKEMFEEWNKNLANDDLNPRPMPMPVEPMLLEEEVISKDAEI